MFTDTVGVAKGDNTYCGPRTYTMTIGSGSGFITFTQPADQYLGIFNLDVYSTDPL